MAKPSKHLVPVGTHVPYATKLSLQAIAESENSSIYEIIQDLIETRVKKYDAEIEKLKKKETPPPVVTESDDSDLLS